MLHGAKQDHAAAALEVPPGSPSQRRSPSAPDSISMACRDASRHRARPRLPDTEDGLPRRSAHVAAQGRRHVKKPEVQNVLMRKSHVTSADMSPDTEAVAAYNEVFQSPLHSTQRRAIRALFSACPSPGEVDDELPA
jgi:hypothetical protein